MSTQKVADFVYGLRFEKLPDPVIRHALKAVKDIIGVSLAAYDDKAVRAARQVALSREGRPESSIIGVTQQLPCEFSAMVNAIMASTLDMDDGSMGLPKHWKVHRGHPGGIVVPAALAVAEKVNASGKDFIEAVVAGYETAMLVARLRRETVLAGCTGVYGAAAATARLMRFDHKQIIETFNVASAHAPWPAYAFIWTRIGMTKEAAGWAAMTGITAALLAKEGFTGTPSYFDWPEHEMEEFASLGRDWEIMGLYFKSYSACRHAHAPVDGVLYLMEQHALAAENIASVLIGCAPAKGLNMSNRRPGSIWQAQYSIPFVIGAAMLEGEVGPDQVSEKRLGDESILRHGDKVELVADEEVASLQPAVFAARVTLITRQGSRYETFIHHPKGDPENPLGSQNLEEKFKKLAGRYLSSKNVNELSDQLNRLVNINDMALFTRALRDLDLRGAGL